MNLGDLTNQEIGLGIVGLLIGGMGYCTFLVNKFENFILPQRIAMHRNRKLAEEGRKLASAYPNLTLAHFDNKGKSPFGSYEGLEEESYSMHHMLDKCFG